MRLLEPADWGRGMRGTLPKDAPGLGAQASWVVALCVQRESSDAAQGRRCLLTCPTPSRQHRVSPSELSENFGHSVRAPPPRFQ